jgi:hypothetical protein
MTHERIRLGISACLLGEPVRFDGGHKHDHTTRMHGYARRRVEELVDHALALSPAAGEDEGRLNDPRLRENCTLFAHPIRRCGVPYLADQVYLRPHPVELMLRNHV